MSATVTPIDRRASSDMERAELIHTANYLWMQLQDEIASNGRLLALNTALLAENALLKQERAHENKILAFICAIPHWSVWPFLGIAFALWLGVKVCGK